MPKTVKRPRKLKTYQPPDPLPLGLILEDIYKRRWRIGPSIGKGGCGEIYLTQKQPSSIENDYPYVMKIEYHENSSLQCELLFYCKHAKEEDIRAYKRTKNIASLGISPYVSSGAPTYNGRDYRFVVMEKLGFSIEKILNENNNKFPSETVFQLAVQILDALEYVHSKGCIHGDIKGSNILLGKNSEAKKQVYLVDFGLAAPCSLIEKPDRNDAHNGTMEYISRDGHLGIASRRGDLEILGFNLIHWLGFTLPWEKDLSNYESVHKSKEKYLKNLTGFFEACFRDIKPPSALMEYMKYVTTLKFDVNPDYRKLRNILVGGLQTTGGSLHSEFQFESSKTPVKRQFEDHSSSSPNEQNNANRTKRGHKSDFEPSVKKDVKIIKTSFKKNSKNNTIKNKKLLKNVLEKVNPSGRSLRPRKCVAYF